MTFLRLGLETSLRQGTSSSRMLSSEVEKISAWGTVACGGYRISLISPDMSCAIHGCLPVV